MFIVVSRQDIEKNLGKAGFSKAEITTIMNTGLFFKDVPHFSRGITNTIPNNNMRQTDTRPSENKIAFSDGLIHSIRDGRAQND